MDDLRRVEEDRLEQPLEDAPATRRAALRAGLILGAGFLLAGCSSPSGGNARRTAQLPNPRWPQQQPIERDWRRPTTPERPTPDYSQTPRQEPSPWDWEYGPIQPRNTWATSNPIPRRMDRMQPVRLITVHHDGMPPVTLQSQADVAARIDQIRAAHQNGQGWGDIGYHFIIDPYGRVWQGRPLEWQGAHVKAQNEGNLGVLLLGNFELQSPTSVALASLDRFVSEQMQRFRVPVSRVLTHREMAPTICPGRTLQAHMLRTRASGGALARA